MGCMSAEILNFSRMAAGSKPPIWCVTKPKAVACKHSETAACPASYSAHRLSLPLWLNFNLLHTIINTCACFDHAWFFGTKHDSNVCHRCSSSCLSQTINRQGSSPKQDGAHRAASKQDNTSCLATSFVKSKARGLHLASNNACVGCSLFTCTSLISSSLCFRAACKSRERQASSLLWCLSTQTFAKVALLIFQSTKGPC